MHKSMIRLVLVACLVQVKLGVVLEFSEITTPMTWNAAFADGRCRIQSDVTGDVDFNNIELNGTIDDDIKEAWVGMYSKLSKALTFGSCRLYREDVVTGLRNLPFGNQADMLETCFRFCNFSRFGFSNDKCFCMGSDVPVFHPQILLHTGSQCLSDQNALCGTAPFPLDSRGTMLSVICNYIPANSSSGAVGSGECAKYNTTNQAITMVDCSHRYNYVCQQVTAGQNVIPSDSATSWWDAAEACTRQNSIFGNKTYVISHVGSTGSYAEAYWVNFFRRTSYSFIAPGEVDSDRCVAVQNYNGILNLSVKNCNETLPVLCDSIGLPSTTTEKATTIFNSPRTGTSTYGVQTTTHAVSTSTRVVVTSTHSIPSKQPIIVQSADAPVLWPLAFIVLGFIVIIAVSVILWRKNKNSRRKMRTSKLIKHMSYGSAKLPENNYELMEGHVPSYETSFIETEPNKATNIVLKTMSITSKKDITACKDETISLSSKKNEDKGETMSLSSKKNEDKGETLSFSSTKKTQENEASQTGDSDNVYNELHEKIPDKQTEDLYDHAREPTVNDDTYDGFRRSGSIGTNRMVDCSDYDTVSGVNAQSTGESSVYDTCTNVKLAKPDVNALNDYDTMASINSSG
ncbi:uncharacterized protein [Argopecten irradians]|uniref:uncharacterized protein n=1 Tax=Argopecten irradians TaxID=31199 RepID=UPI003720A3C2